MVALFDILMQNSYKIQKNKMKEVHMYITRLGDALNAVHREHPHSFTEHNVEVHLGDHMFHGLMKNLRDSLQY